MTCTLHMLSQIVFLQGAAYQQDEMKKKEKKGSIKSVKN